METHEKKWEGLTPEEKREERFKTWLEAPDVIFDSPEAKKGYRERVTRLIKAFKLQEPDRVPVQLPVGYFPLYHSGGSLYKAMYEPDFVRQAYLKYIPEFKDYMDYFTASGINSGRGLEIIDYKLTVWPGHGLAENTSAFQFVENENMKAEEYDTLINNPSDWVMKTFMPRVMGTIAPFKDLPTLVSLLSKPTALITAAAQPSVRTAFQAIIDAGIEEEKIQKVNREINQAALAAGLPLIREAAAAVPFDVLGDYLRGTREIMMDIFRRPQKIHQALEKITELTIERVKVIGNDINTLAVGFPLHKGDDTFMSDKQFETFYWPMLKEIIQEITKEGLIVFLFAEGSYNNRLKQVADLPEGWVIWRFDRTDMFKAKQILGNQCCIVGNVPASLMCTGTPQEVKDYCRKLIETCGKGGGYILAGGASATKTNAANLKAMMAAAKESNIY